MGPKPVTCALCANPSKYRCSACPVRYCSVACYKAHKLECTGKATAQQTPEQAEEAPEQPAPEPTTTVLRPLTSLRWPPEPDASVFMDPLKRDDPKPLRTSQLESIAKSSDLRELLALPQLTSILYALDSLPPPQRSSSLARILGVDPASLAKPAASALLRSSPPPLEDLLTSNSKPDDWGSEGWWLGKEKVWIGPEERRLMRTWAGVVTRAIDGGDGSWGQGGLQWEV